MSDEQTLASLFGPLGCELRMFVVAPRVRLVGDVKMPLPGAGAKFDLLAALIDPLEIVPGARVSIPTGLCITPPDGFAVRVESRADLALTHGVTVLAWDETSVVLHNRNRTAYQVRPKTRIAVGMIVPVAVVSKWETEK